MTVDHFVLEGLKNFWKTVSLVKDTRSFSTNLPTIFKGRIFQMLFSSQYCDFGPGNFVIQTELPLEFSKKVPLSLCPPVGHTVDLNYRGIQQFRIRQTKRPKYLDT